jgi:hypothetical protein
MRRGWWEKIKWDGTTVRIHGRIDSQSLCIICVWGQQGQGWSMMTSTLRMSPDKPEERHHDQATRGVQALGPKIADLRGQNLANLCPSITDLRHFGWADLRVQLSRIFLKCNTMSLKARISLLMTNTEVFIFLH